MAAKMSSGKTTKMLTSWKKGVALAPLERSVEVLAVSNSLATLPP